MSFHVLVLLEQIFNYGFRSSRKFQKHLYIWDFLERIHEYFTNDSCTEDGLHGGQMHQHPCQMLVNVLARINTNNPSIGKVEKVIQTQESTQLVQYIILVLHVIGSLRKNHHPLL